MPDGTGLNRFKKEFPNRFFDVGIAEEHAVTFAAGLASNGIKPYVVIYSSFLQRAYDQILHDVCIQDLDVVFCIDRAGIVGADGETHQGIFDISFLSNIPNLNIFAPKNKYELEQVLEFSEGFNHPLAIRYPRGVAYDGLEKYKEPIRYGKSEVIYKEKDIVLLAAGTMVETAYYVREKLKEAGYCCSLVNARFLKPLDEELLTNIQDDHCLVVTMEENVLNGGFGEKVNAFASSINADYRVLNIAIPNLYVEHGDVSYLKKLLGLDTDTIVDRILKEVQEI